MNPFGGFKETSDVSDMNKENKPEISQNALNKFEKIMSDERLSAVEQDQTKKGGNNSPFLNLMDKFESFFKSEPVANITGSTEADIASETDSSVADEINHPHEHNSEYKIVDDTYETDDIGTTYKKNGELLSNTEYIVNGNIYRTDENGNKVSCDAKPEIHEEGKRNITEQRESGGEDRREGDQGGHIIARILGGAEGEENLVPMRGTINQGDYKKMELEIKRALEDGKQVSIHIDLKYDGMSSRPTKIMATYTINEKKTDIVFDNEENSIELLDALDTKLSDGDFAQLKEEIDDMKEDGCPASITSVKTEYNENGMAAKVIVGVLDESAGTKSYKVFNAC